MRFTKAWIGAEDQGPVNTVISGDEVSFHVEYTAPQLSGQPTLLISMSVRDLHGQLLFSMGNFLTGEHIELTKTTGHLWTTLPELPLNAGTYQVDLWASLDSTASDYITGAYQFTVIEADVFGSGKVPVARKHGPMYVITPGSRNSGPDACRGLVTIR